MLLESHTPHKIVILLFIVTNENEKLTVLLSNALGEMRGRRKQSEEVTSLSSRVAVDWSD